MLKTKKTNMQIHKANKKTNNKIKLFRLSRDTNVARCSVTHLLFSTLK